MPTLDYAVLSNQTDNLIKLNGTNAAGYLGVTGTQELLLKDLGEARDPIVRGEALAFLAERALDPKAVALVAKSATGDRDPYVRRKACIALEARPGKEVGNALDAALRDKDAQVRRAAAVSVGASARQDLTKDLESLLQDEFDTVRRAASESLAMLKAGGQPSSWMASELKARRVHVTGGSAAHEWRRWRTGLTEDVLQIGAIAITLEQKSGDDSVTGDKSAGTKPAVTEPGRKNLNAARQRMERTAKIERYIDYHT